MPYECTLEQGDVRIFIHQTSMHSSRMGTARLLTVSRSIPLSREEGCSLHPFVGGGVLHRGGESCIEGGYAASRKGGWADPLPPANRMTDRCKNITLPQTSFPGDNYDFVR